MPPSPDLAALAGAYRLRPGRRPAIVGERPVLEGGRLAGLLEGLPAVRAPDTCAAVFTLCAHAHRRTSAAAVQAALGERSVEGSALSLECETARDHLRAIALDWPARAGRAPDLAWLHDSPLRLAGPAPQDAVAAMRLFAQWLQGEVLHRAPTDWLARCRTPAGLKAWCQERASTFGPAATLLQWHAVGEGLELSCVPLRVLDTETRDATLRELAASLAGDPTFAQLPHWRGESRETGPWTRQRHAPAALPSTAWQRLAARWIELVELATAACDDGPPLLQQGALQLAEGEAIAWCEMARGLLFHWLRLDAAGRIAGYRVLAPTEWNFHPDGALARALERLQPSDVAAAALLATAFDACVPCTVDAGA